MAIEDTNRYVVKSFMEEGEAAEVVLEGYIMVWLDRHSDYRLVSMTTAMEGGRIIHTLIMERIQPNPQTETLPVNWKDVILQAKARDISPNAAFYAIDYGDQTPPDNE